MSAAVESNTSVTASIDVAVSQRAAFDVFTAGFDRWWNRDHHLLDGEMKRAVIEQGVGGRVFEESVDGTICEWGEVLAWDPPNSFAYSWRIGPNWAAPATDAPYSTITVTFTPTDTGTHVALVHSGLDAHGNGWEQLRDSVGSDGGWPGLLELFAAAT